MGSNIPQRNMPRYKFECETDTPEVQSLRKKLKQSRAYADRRDREYSELKSRYSERSKSVEWLSRQLREWKDRAIQREREIAYWKARFERVENPLRHRGGHH